ncbi:hypothetical protein BA724_00725 [Domibacillus iocasae]|uniref:Uncharacterized protein n=1 Tax=Domibacillus iocasae TaxID=1714016 RepID=A0A1E7DUC3_9BACI|nr:hypothetical protein BA724_00725 [Domibacillus iocasae]
MRKKRRMEQEMMDLLLGFAVKDERVRLMGINGSRVNPNAPNDEFQEYNIVYEVIDMESFLHNPDWIDVFGKQLMMQTPKNMTLFPPQLGGRNAVC